MKKALRLLAPLALLAALAPAGLMAQEGVVTPAQLPPEAQELIAELQQIQADLAPIQQRAFQDQELAAEQQALAADIETRMVEADPSVPAQVERLRALMAGARDAQEAGDQERMNEVVTEARHIEQRLQSAQAAALQHPDIAPRLEAFQSHLQERMVEVDPAAATLLARAKEIDRRLTDLLDEGP